MKPKTLIPFLVILAVLIGLVAWQKINVKPAVPLATQIGLESLVPEGMTKDSVKKLELYLGETPDKKVVLERDGDAWKISSLYNAPAGKETVDKFLDGLLALKGEPRANADTEERLAGFALTDKDAFHVRAFQQDMETPSMEVLFGKSADYRTVFLRKADSNKVFVEATNLRRDAGVTDTGEITPPKQEKWLEGKMLDLGDAAITKLALKYPDKELVLTREEVKKEPEPAAAEGESEGEGEITPPKAPEVTYKWVVSQGGLTTPVNETEVKNLLTRFASVTATNVADPERKADWGFDPPLYSVTISREGAEDMVLLGGRDKPGGETYMQLAGAQPELIYQVSKYNFEQVFLQGSKLFTLPEWTAAKESLRNITITGPQGNIALAWDGSAWKVSEPQLSLETQKTTLDNIIAAAASLKPTDYADAGRDLGAFDTTINMTLEGGATRTLTLGQPSQYLDGRYAKFDGSNDVLVLSRADAEKLSPPVRDLFVLSVLDFDVAKVKQIHMTAEGADVVLTRGDTPDKWSGNFNSTLIAPESAKVDDLIHALNDFQVDNFLLDRAVDSVQGISTAVVTLEDGAETTIKVAAESNGVHELTISGLPYVFTAAKEDLTDIISQVSAFESMTPPPVETVPTETSSAVSEVVPPEGEPTTETVPLAPESAPTVEPVVITPAPIEAPSPASAVEMPPAAPEVTLPAEPAAVEPPAPVEGSHLAGGTRRGRTARSG